MRVLILFCHLQNRMATPDQQFELNLQKLTMAQVVPTHSPAPSLRSSSPPSYLPASGPTRRQHRPRALKSTRKTSLSDEPPIPKTVDEILSQRSRQLFSMARKQSELVAPARDQERREKEEWTRAREERLRADAEAARQALLTEQTAAQRKVDLKQEADAYRALKLDPTFVDLLATMASQVDTVKEYKEWQKTGEAHLAQLHREAERGLHSPEDMKAETDKLNFHMTAVIQPFLDQFETLNKKRTALVGSKIRELRWATMTKTRSTSVTNSDDDKDTTEADTEMQGTH
jgi:hypothetical protein